jgi:hypothetical protein
MKAKVKRFNQLDSHNQIDFALEFMATQFELDYKGLEIEWIYKEVIKKYEREQPFIPTYKFVEEQMINFVLDYLTKKNPETQRVNNILAIFFA